MLMCAWCGVELTEATRSFATVQTSANNGHQIADLALCPAHGIAVYRYLTDAAWRAHIDAAVAVAAEHGAVGPSSEQFKEAANGTTN